MFYFCLLFYYNFKDQLLNLFTPAIEHHAYELTRGKILPME